MDGTLALAAAKPKEDEAGELHAFEMRTLSAGSIHKHPLLINSIYSCDQLSRMGPKGDIGRSVPSMKHLNITLVGLSKKPAFEF